MRGDYFYHNPARGDYDGAIPWSLTGLTNGGTYNLTFFSRASNQHAYSSIDGFGLGTPDTEGDYNFTNVVATGTTITGLWDAPSGNHTWSGLQFEEVITSTPIPEPATTALLGLGGLALIFRRRK